MTLNARLYRLTVLHRQIDDALRREMRRRGADPFRLLRLKALKRMVKDRLMKPALRPAFAR